MSQILPLDPCPFFDNYDAYRNYESKVDERIRQLVEEGKWDSDVMIDYEAGEISRSDVYRLAHKEACEQIYEEVNDVFSEPW